MQRPSSGRKKKTHAAWIDHTQDTVHARASLGHATACHFSAGRPDPTDVLIDEGQVWLPSVCGGVRVRGREAK
ncbi:MAG: hypothetical protein IID36_12125 [Planctomycetes bacterium]|nr:hypothetical protein [Planctomycetota bacterium]